MKQNNNDFAVLASVSGMQLKKIDKHNLSYEEVKSELYKLSELPYARQQEVFDNKRKSKEIPKYSLDFLLVAKLIASYEVILDSGEQYATILFALAKISTALEQKELPADLKKDNVVKLCIKKLEEADKELGLVARHVFMGQDLSEDSDLCVLYIKAKQLMPEDIEISAEKLDVMMKSLFENANILSNLGMRITR